VVIVGDNDEARSMEEMLAADPGLGYDVTTRVVLRAGVNREDAGAVLVDDTLRAVEDTAAHGVIIVATALDSTTSNKLIRSLAYSGLHLELSSNLSGIAADRLTMRPIGRFPVVYIEPVRRFGWRPVAKRAFDVVGAAGLLLVTAPALLAVAVAVKATSPGPVLFSQERLGRDGRIFRVHKFRTMVQDAEARLAELEDRNEADGPLFKMTHDPRVTRIGGFLRSSSLDELPQLWNVLRGEMSLVGPRPERPELTASFEVSIPGYARRHELPPGMTGLAQIHGRYHTDPEYKLGYDLQYLVNWSPVLDLEILFRTVWVVLARRI
jgi:exopolysaccharide biosynthesis polyprenyl glycosylphosphotransferase